MGYKCQKHGIIDGDEVENAKTSTDPNNPDKENNMPYLVCRKCQGVVETKSNYCNRIIGRWKELRSKLPVAQDLGKPYKISYISPEERFELGQIEQQLSDECSNLLSPSDKFEIDKNKFIEK